MNKKEILQILKLLKKNKKKVKKNPKTPKIPKPYENVSKLIPQHFSMVKYQPDFHKESPNIIREYELLSKQLQELKQELRQEPIIKRTGIRKPTEINNQIITQPLTYSRTDSEGLETAIGGTSDEFLIEQQPKVDQVEAPNIISIGAPKPKRVYIKKPKTISNTII